MLGLLPAQRGRGRSADLLVRPISLDSRMAPSRGAEQEGNQRSHGSARRLKIGPGDERHPSCGVRGGSQLGFFGRIARDISAEYSKSSALAVSVELSIQAELPILTLNGSTADPPETDRQSGPPAEGGVGVHIPTLRDADRRIPRRAFPICPEPPGRAGRRYGPPVTATKLAT